MKLIVTLLLLSAAVVSFAAVAKAPEAPAEAPAARAEAPAEDPAAPGKAARDTLYIGHIGSNDRMLQRGYVYYQGVPNSKRFEYYMYRGTVNTRISAIRVYEVDAIQYATASLFQGGIGQNYATVRVESAWGMGYYCFIEIYGH